MSFGDGGRRPGADEVERAKSYLAGITRIRLQTNGAVTSEIMENYLDGLELDFTGRLLESIRSVTVDDLREVAKTHFSGDNYPIQPCEVREGGRMDE